MTAVNASERTRIEAAGIELGWAINKDARTTVLAYQDRTVTVWWSDNGHATHSIITDQAGTVLGERRWFAYDESVGDWVLRQLHEQGPRFQAVSS